MRSIVGRDMTFKILKNHLDTHFPDVWGKIDSAKVTTALLFQVKGSDVHPNQRHARYFFPPSHKNSGKMKNKKTQIDITGSSKNSNPNYISPVTAILPIASGGGKYHPVTVFNPSSKTWVNTHIKYNAMVATHAGPAKNQARRLWGGRDPNSWSSNLWAHVGNESTDKWGFILFLREGWNNPVSFHLPNHSTLEQLLIDHGSSKEDRYTKTTGRFAHLCGSPKTSKVVIGGPGIAKPTGLQYMYVVTWPGTPSLVKIGESTQLPISRLRGYDTPNQADMHLIYLTSDCKTAEKEVQKRLKMAGYTLHRPTSRDLFDLPAGINDATHAIQVVKNVIDTMYPPPSTIGFSHICTPIIRSKTSWAY